MTKSLFFFAEKGHVIFFDASRIALFEVCRDTTLMPISIFGTALPVMNATTYTLIWDERTFFKSHFHTHMKNNRDALFKAFAWYTLIFWSPYALINTERAT